MTRKLLPLALLLFAAVASARTRAVSTGPGSGHMDAKRTDGGTVSGTIDSVSGNILSLAGGLVTIDASKAKIVASRGGIDTLAELKPGMLLFATIETNDVPANAPLVATMVSAVPIPDATLFGTVQHVDVSSRTFALLGRTIHVTNNTSFGGFDMGHLTAQPGLGNLMPRHLVQVQTDAVDGRLVATAVLLLSPIPPSVHHARGTVRSIGSDAWVIGREGEGELRVVVNAQTKIIGSPKVGDKVEVLYGVNSAHENVAISIAKFDRDPDVPSNQNLFHGTVKSIAPTAWVITASAGKDVQVKIHERTRIEPGIVVGDRVEVIAIGQGEELTAIVIVKKRF